MSPRTITILSFTFASTIIVALWAIDFSAGTKRNRSNETDLDLNVEIPIQTRLAPRPPMALGPVIAGTNKSADETAIAHVAFNAQGQTSIFNPDVRSELPRTLATANPAAIAPFVAHAVSFNDPNTNPVHAEELHIESALPSTTRITQFSSVAVNQLQTSELIPKPIVVPAALKEIASDTIPSPLTPVQEQAVTRVQDSFVEEIGGEEQAANDPEYKERWITAQPIADQRLRAQIGDEAFREYQKALIRSAVATQGKVAP